MIKALEIKDIAREAKAASASASEAMKEWGEIWRAGRLASSTGRSFERQGSSQASRQALALAFAAGLTLAGAGMGQGGLAPNAPEAASGQSAQEDRGWSALKSGLGWLWGARSPKTEPLATPEDTEAALAPLPLALPGPGEAPWSDLRLAKELLKVDSFMALAVTVERLPDRGYMDDAGANVGAGYCLSRRMRDHGEARVREDLKAAGFREDQIEALTSLKRERVEGVRVTQAQGLRLLALMKPSYEALAISATGSELWESLAEHKRSALSYLAYNTGNVGSFKKLLEAAKQGDDAEALRQMSVAWKDRRGRAQKNHRLRAWAQAAWASRGTLNEAVREPLIFELSFAGKRGQEGFIKAALKRSKGRGMEIKELRLSENLERRQKEHAEQELAEQKRALAQKPGKLKERLKKAREKKSALRAAELKKKKGVEPKKQKRLKA